MANKTDNREIVVSREFDAPREIVFAAFTEQEHVENWWLPKNGETILWDGKMWRYKVPGHGGNMMPFRINFVEIDKPNKLVYDYGTDMDDAPEPVRTNVTFEDQDGKTKVTLQLIFPTAAEREQAVKYGAIVGAMQALEELAEYLA
jgi:uncharacterized protein YndB with AHSA1/START domain